VKTEVSYRGNVVDGFDAWHTLHPGDDVENWLGFFWHGTSWSTQYPGLASAWFEVEL
jgi:hypothetical protein